MEGYKVKDLIGVPSDYSDRNNWVHLPEKADKEVDTFYIYPTVYLDPSPDAPAIAPIDNKMMRTNAKRHFSEAPQVFMDLTNLYGPFYRQTNIFALAGKNEEEFQSFQYDVQRTDIYAAFDYYFEHFNHGRPFILAGHSQGSMMIKIALKDYFLEHSDYLKRMVAAYVIGFSFTTEDLKANPALKFAEGADDTGVIVSWNTEGPENSDAKSVVVTKNAISINPLNWKRDDTYAPASENLGDRLPAEEGIGMFLSAFTVHRPGIADAKLDVDRGVVVCSTLPDRYYVPMNPGARNPFGPASLHIFDYYAYWDNIRENVLTRIGAYLRS